MDAKLLTAAVLGAALTLSAAPGQAQPVPGIPIATTPEPPGLRPIPDRPGLRAIPERPGRCTDGNFRHMRNDVRFRCGFGDGFAYADGEWALYNNRAFDPSSYNDWWNDRPDRAFPRWVQEQHARGTCDPDRMWWSGSGWHC